MAAGEYQEAAFSFSYSLSRVQKREGDPSSILVHGFNCAEVHRRITQKPNRASWVQVIELFDKAGATSAAPLTIQSNHLQAIHIAFAMTGDLPRARETLSKARHAAELLGPAEDIFTVKTYTNVPVKEWIAINDEMLAALDRGQLWDGMAVPCANPKEETDAAPSQEPKDKG